MGVLRSPHTRLAVAAGTAHAGSRHAATMAAKAAALLHEFAAEPLVQDSLPSRGFLLSSCGHAGSGARRTQQPRL